MPGRCLFCSIGPVTGEHVIAQSLSKRLWEVSPFTPEHGAPVEPKPGATRFHTNRIIDMVVNAACDDCNSSPTNSTSGSLSEPRTGAAR
jgi:Fe-S cluster biogenesis protein NfuA